MPKLKAKLAVFYSLTAVLLLAFSVIAKAEAPPTFSHVMPRQLEALAHINSIAEDRFGFIWFAGESGLARFDGYDLKIYLAEQGQNNALPSNTINDLLLTSNGEFWMVTEKGLVKYLAESDSFEQFFVAGERQSKPNPEDNFFTVYETPNGDLLLGGVTGLYRFDRGSKRATRIPVAPNQPAHMVVYAIDAGANGEYWLGTNDGLMRYDPEQQLISAQTLNHPRLAHADVRSILWSDDQRLWLGTFSGLIASVDTHTMNAQLIAHDASQRIDNVWAIMQDSNGQIWAGDGAGLNKINVASGRMQRFSHDPSDIFSIGNYAVKSLYQDSRGDFWVGFFPAGVDHVDWSAAAFQNFYHRPLEANSVAAGGILSVVEDQQQNLWLGAGLGLSYFDRQSGTFTLWQDLYPNSPLLGNTVTSLLLTDSNHLWIASWNHGLNEVDLKSGKVTHHHDRTQGGSLLGVEPWSLLKDRSGQLWVATELGLNVLDSTTGKFKTVKLLDGGPENAGIKQMQVRVVIQDRAGDIWVGTNEGLFRLNEAGEVLAHYQHDEQDAYSLKANFVRALYEDKAGNLWVGTNQGGISRLNRVTGAFSHIDIDAAENVGLQTVTSITEDANGNIWFVTLHGAALYNTTNQKLEVFTTEHGLLDNLFNRNAAMRLQNGEIFLGSTKGFTIFDPADINRDPVPNKAVFTQLDVLNQEAVIGAEGSALAQNILTANKITLLPHQSVFTIHFAALNFSRPKQSHYSIMLEGFDRNWQPTTTEPNVTYTNLDPGQYTLKVRAANADEQWSEEVAQITIEVLPPWYKTGWAYTFYGLLILLAFVLFASFQLRRVELVQQKLLNARLRKLDKVKDTFLANTSHELRTPLNGMIGIADHLMETEQLSDNAFAKLEMIKSSGRRLSNLVNDILDYAKLTEHSLELRIQSVGLQAVIHDTFHLLGPLTQSKSLTLELASKEPLPCVMADENRLQQILINLIGNAIKYTDEGGIKVDVSSSGDTVKIQIIDSGIGISKEEVNSIFIAFHQLHGLADNLNVGTGLGLAITKQLVEMQGGSVGVDSTPGQGSCFWFTLQKSVFVSSRSTQPTVKKFKALNEGLMPSIASTARNAKAKVLPMIEKPEQYRVMIVDDDPVNSLVLRGMLEQQKYQVIELNNGDAALAEIEGGNKVDLMLLDIMMPRLDGFEVCKKIRERFNLHELPVLFLTAHKNDDDLQKGFAVGANEFLTKPVSKYELLALVANHLRVAQISRKLGPAGRAG